MQAIICGQHFSFSDRSLVVSKSVGVYEIEFVFDSAWADWNKTAVFEGSGQTIEKVIVDGKAGIPWEVLQTDGPLKIGVYGTKGDGSIMPTVWGDKVIIKRGTPTGSIGTEPTPSIYVQILEMANNAKDIANEAKDTAEEAYARAVTAQDSAERYAAAAGSAAASANASANNASASETNAAQSEAAAAESAGQAASSATSAGSSASAASASETNAAASAVDAAQSEAAAAESAGQAASSATSAGSSASAASASETNAAASATDAAEAKTDAEAARDKAQEYTESIDPNTIARTWNIASEYSASATYEVGDYCIYNSQLYRCVTAITTAEAWTPAHWTAVVLGNDTSGLRTDVNSLADRVSNIEETDGLHKYGVSGIGQKTSALTRIWDSVGMTAQAGTDGDNSNVVNNFDDVTPFNRKKCVGHWTLHDGRPQFIVEAYLGDADYAEDGTKGDYVAVECPRAYYYLKDGILGVSAHHYPGWKPFDIFCHNHNADETFEYAYLPAYALAVKDGHAVSLPGLDNEQGSYAYLFNTARTYNNDDVKGFAMMQPWAVIFYEWALQTVEYAKQVPTDIMKGCISLRSADGDTVTFLDATHVLTNNYYAARVVGEYIAITPSGTGHTNVSYQATHKIVSITRCDENGNADASGTHQNIEVLDLGKNYLEYDTTGLTIYALAPRPYRTGACNDVSTPSGSPVSNTSGYYPCKYRHRENPWGNQYHTIVDLFNKRVQDENEQYYLEWYYLPDPSKITVPSNTINLPSENYVKLDVETSPANYVNGYIKDRQYADEYPDVWIPGATSGASASTYYAVYAYLVNSSAVRSVRFGASWNFGTVALNAYSAPSYSNASSGADLCFAQ